MPLVNFGHKDFGENKVQETQNKWPKILEKHSDINLHMIGKLQTNKVKEAVKLFNSCISLKYILGSWFEGGKHIRPTISSCRSLAH